MGKLVVIVIIDVVEAEGSCQVCDGAGVASQEGRRRREVAGSNLRTLQNPRVGRGVLGIKADHDEAKIAAGAKPAASERAGNNRDHGTAKGLASVVREHPYAWCGA